ncbi:MAG: hypothetical protein M1834_006352 [Cirrosporium novae-zelandiae]|nr:MAG: hypothetical protein M1834_006352 [Cirrosporium novae-zelandiae]
MEKSNLDPESGRGPSPKSFSHWTLILNQAPLTPEIENWNYEGSGTDEDPYVVGWIENDPRDPMRTPVWKKWVFTYIEAILTLAVAFGSSSYAGSIDSTIEDFNVSVEIATLGLALYVLGFALGPVIWAPLSENNGRQSVLFVSYGLFTIFNAAAVGSPNITALIIFRFLAGTFGSSPYTNAGAVIADIFSVSERGFAMTLFAAAPFMGPVIGPIIGGFLGEAAGWRWVQGLLALFSGALWIISALVVPETYAPYLLHKRAEKLSKITGKVYKSGIEAIRGRKSTLELLKTALLRPLVLLFHEPIVGLLSLWMAIVYGTLYLLFGAYPIVYQEKRGWSQGVGSLPYLGIMIGMFGAILYNYMDNERYKRKVKKDGPAPPESRLPSAMVGGIALTIGLFWFAWTCTPSIHWIVSVISGAPFGFGMVLIFVAIKNYLVDAYTIFAASTLAATVFLRSIFGFAFPLFTTYMYDALGLNWASMIPAFLALACSPMPFLFYKFGIVIRAKCKFASEADMYMKKLQMQVGEGLQTSQGNTPRDESRIDIQNGEKEAGVLDFQDGEKLPRPDSNKE